MPTPSRVRPNEEVSSLAREKHGHVLFPWNESRAEVHDADDDDDDDDDDVQTLNDSLRISII